MIILPLKSNITLFSLKIENKNLHLTTHFTNESQIIFPSKVALIGSVRYFLQLFYCALKLIYSYDIYLLNLFFLSL